MARPDPIQPDLTLFPDGDLVAKGLNDLREGQLTNEAMLVSLARPSLMSAGLSVPELENVERPYEHRLYEALEGQMPRGAHGAYNALIGRIVSFAHAYAGHRSNE